MCDVRIFSLCYVRMFRLCYVRFFESVLCADFSIVLCAFFRRWLAASRLAARFARVARFARLFVTLTSVRGGTLALSFADVGFTPDEPPCGL